MYVICLIYKKQFCLKIGDKFFINKIDGLVSNIVCFNNIIFFKNEDLCLIGSPFVKNIYILTKLISIKKSKKKTIIKFKRRNNYLKKKGHRQILMEFLVLDIIYGD